MDEHRNHTRQQDHLPGSYCSGHVKGVEALCYNVIGIPVATAILYPTFVILLSPVFATSLSSVPVIANVLGLGATTL